jgi:hypothetical protein
LAPVAEGSLDEANTHLCDCLAWVGEQMRTRGDLHGAAKAALLHRHILEDGTMTAPFLYEALSRHMNKEGHFAGVDFLRDRLHDLLDKCDP